MKRYIAVVFLLVTGLLAVALAQVVGEQSLLRMSFITDGISARGDRVLQTGQLSKLSALAALDEPVEVIPAPASGQIYLRGIWVEKTTTSAAGVVTITAGTEDEDPCDTDDVTIAVVNNPPFGFNPLGVLIPAGLAVCIEVNATTTGVRALYSN